MNSRKIYLTFMSALLIGAGAFFLLREIAQKEIALSLAITLSAGAAIALFVYSSKLASRNVRAFAGLALVFGAICFGARNEGEMFAFSVLWAGILFAALDSLGKLGTGRSHPIEAA